MALRQILTQGHPTLNKKSREVTVFGERLNTLLDDMHETLIKAEGMGLAAPQVGILRRVVLVDNGEKVLELINPEIIKQSGEQDGEEGCLSVPGKFGLVKRPAFVMVKAQDRNGEWHEYGGLGITARCFCHELAHLDGQLYTEVAYKMLTEEELIERRSKQETQEQ